MTPCDTPCEPALIRVSNPGDLIETVPFLMGFHPTESVVLVGFTDHDDGRPHRVSVTLRFDLPTDPFELADLLPVPAALTSSATDSVVAVVATDRLSGDPRDVPELVALTEALADDLELLGLRILDVLVATAGHWWSMLCCDEQCCPPAGTARRRSGSTAAAEAAYAGLVALPDRQSLAATLVGRTAAERARLDQPLRVAEQHATVARQANRARWQRTEIAAILKAARTGEPAPLTDDQLARFAVACSDPEIRDAVWLAVDARTLDADRLLVQLHSQTPDRYSATPLFLYGWSQWRAGNGTLAMMAAERAVQLDPECTVATLLIGAIERGLDPRTTPPLGSLPTADR